MQAEAREGKVKNLYEILPKRRLFVTFLERKTLAPLTECQRSTLEKNRAELSRELRCRRRTWTLTGKCAKVRYKLAGR